MYKRLSALLVGVLVCCATTGAEELAPGMIVPEVKCNDDSGYSYILRLPKNYDPNRKEKWPVLFLMSPSGGKTRLLERYVPGADQCGWILAMSVQSKNENDGAVSHKAILAMVEDVFERFPVNEKHCYASGFSGGARESYWLAKQLSKSIRGIIPCGAGGVPGGSGLLAYGLSGATCFNRWDMTVAFHQRFKEDGILRFFPGKHQWADDRLLTQAMLWLEGKYLAEKGEDAEIATFSAALLAEINRNLETDPVLAYERCAVLAGIKDAPDFKEAKELLESLEKDPAVQTYRNALADISEFADEHYNTSPMDCYNKPTTPEMIDDAHGLVKKYAGTPYEELMVGLGTATPDM